MRFERPAILLLAIGALVFLILSAASLYVFPVPDSYRWYGDETWLLLGWKSLLLHGQMTVPVALGSTLSHSSGFVTGSAWLCAILYGLPQVLAPYYVDITVLGRTVTFTLALVTLGILIAALHRFKVSTLVSALVLFLLVSCDAFIVNTHSARYDTATGLAILFVAYWSLVRADRSELRIGEWAFLGAACGLLLLTVSPHLAVLIPAEAAVIWVFFRGYASPKASAVFFGAAALAVLFIAALYAFFSPSLSLLGDTKYGSQFFSVLGNVPVRSLFSPSAMRRVAWAKSYYLVDEAPSFAVGAVLVLISSAVLFTRRRGSPVLQLATAMWLALLVAAFLFQSTLPYYLMHLLPLTALVLALHLDVWARRPLGQTALPIVALLAISLLSWQRIPRLFNSASNGRALRVNNSSAIQAAIEHLSMELPPEGPKPVILAQGPAITELLRDTSLQVMSESFLFFPDSTLTPLQVLRRYHVRYALDYHRPMTHQYQSAIEQLGTPIFSRTGHLLDRSVHYSSEELRGLDTLTLYRIREDSAS